MKGTEFLLKLILFSSFLAWVLFALVYIGSETNWFRYGLSLEGTVIFLLLSFLSCTVFILHKLAGSILKKNSSSNIKRYLFLCLAVLSTVIGITFVMMQAGSPQFYLNDIRTTSVQYGDINGKQVSYYLEIRNPWSSGVDTFLILEDAKKYRIQVPLNDSSQLLNLHDAWGELEQFSSEKYELSVEGFSTTWMLEIDISKSEARLIKEISR